MKEETTGKTPIAALGEFGFIKHITQHFKTRQPSTIRGVGDDGAVLDFKGKLTVVSTDLLLEGIHFDLIYHPLKHLGYKAVIANLSDIYAMNARPTQITVSIGLSSRFTVEAVDEIYFGIRHACEKYEVDLVGGDTSSTMRGLVISVTAIGEVTPDRVVYRSGARPGDILCVSGDLGGAYLGLQLLEREKRIYLETPEVQPDLEDKKYIVGRQLKPEARRDIWEFLAEKNVVPTAMIDISDGLSSEILHLCEQSNTGCLLLEREVPIHRETYETALQFNLDPITCALSGGEDYELLFTIKPEDLPIIEEHYDISIIGEMKPASYGAKLFTKGGNYHKLIAQGWQAFKKEE